MKYLSIRLFFLAVMLILDACAPMPNWQDQACNINGAYARGMNDGLYSGIPNASPSAGCPNGSNFSGIDAAYKQGFAVGSKYTGD